MDAIVYATGAVGCNVIGCAPGQDAAQVAAKRVPDGSASIIVDAAMLPSVDQSAWKIVAGAIVVDSGGLSKILVAYAADKRWRVETGGIVVGGSKIATDEASQAKVNGAWSSTQIDPSFTTNWKGADGTWSTLNAAAIVAIASAVKDHVKACFAAEKACDDAITASAMKSTADVDAYAWPSNS